MQRFLNLMSILEREFDKIETLNNLETYFDEDTTRVYLYFDNEDNTEECSDFLYDYDYDITYIPQSNEAIIIKL